MDLKDLSAASPYLASDDYAVGTVMPPVEIVKIEMQDVPVPNSTKKQAKAVIFLKGVPKGYVVNKNVARKIAQALGETKNIERTWLGAVISLEVVGDVRRPDGTKGNAFRLRSAARAAQAPPAAPTTPAEPTNQPA
jgi:hypothetical protein